MPNRMIKESIHTSETVNAMTDFQFRLWVNLITYVDDFGRGDARPAVIKGTCFPLRERMTSKDIEAALNALAGIGCVSLYEVDGRPYLCFPNWGSHQNIRNQKSKFPPPANNCEQLQTIANNCARNPNQSESESEIESETEGTGAELPAGRSTPQPTPSEFDIPLNDGSVYNVPMENIAAYKKLYPAVDVEQELRGMIGWCMSNPKRRKTKGGVKRFINGWLAKEQDKAGMKGGRNGVNRRSPDQGAGYQQYFDGETVV